MNTFCLLVLASFLATSAAGYEYGEPPSFNWPQVEPRPGPFIGPVPEPGYDGVMALPAMVPEGFRDERDVSGWTRPVPRPDVPDFQRPQIQPPHPGGPFIGPRPEPGYAGVMTLPAMVPEGFRGKRDVSGWTRPNPRPDVPDFQRPQIQPSHPGGPFIRPRPDLGYAGVMTLPAMVPEGFRGKRDVSGWTRPNPRPDVPDFQRPQIQPSHPGYAGVTTLPERVPAWYRGGWTRPAPRPGISIPKGESEICSSCDGLSFKRVGACCRRWNLCC